MQPSPELIEAVAAQFGPLAATPERLGGGITNHNFRARFGEHDVVLRVSGAGTGQLGIDRTNERNAAEGAAALGLAPAVLAFLPEHDCLVTAFVVGTPLQAGDLRRSPADLAAVARGLRAFHQRGPILGVPFAPHRTAATYLAKARHHNSVVPDGAPAAVDVAVRIAAALAGPEHAPVPCHDDLLPANLVGDGERLWLVDWEYAGMGDRYFDLGNLSVNNGFDEADDERLLEAYWDQPVTPARFASLRLMRAASDVREAMWGVLQSAVSDLDFDFIGYAEHHLARLQATTGDPRFETWLRDAASA
jgi:aminoglycoside phosphotransferase